jgi:hypothetical protein
VAFDGRRKIKNSNFHTLSLRFKGDSTSNTTAATGQNKFETQLASWLSMRQGIH